MKEKFTDMPLGARLLMPVIAIGLCAGVGIGLYVGWMVWPVQLTNVDVSDLRGSAKEDYIVLTAKTFAYDQNLDDARDRLTKLNDPKVEDRVAVLALAYASQNRPEAAQLASLAMALGSQMEGIAYLAATPEPVARIVTSAATNTLVVPPITPVTLTVTPVVTSTVTRTPTRRVTSTPTKIAPLVAPILATSWLPDYPAEWPGGVKLEPVFVSAGQQYWHMTKAIYCDITETRFGCKDTGGGNVLPGGPGTIGVWVTLVGGKAPLILDGKPANLEDKSGDAQCQCTYTLDFPGPTIAIGSYPSEKLSGAANASVHVGFPNTHVRYFFTFQLVTR